jgi:predicted esterase
VRIVNVTTPTTGRVLIEDAAGSFSGRVIVGCHGYGQSAETMLEELGRIPGLESWRRVSIQGLHRFYTRHDQAVVASWMTRQDREAAIADNIEYFKRAMAAAGADDAQIIVLLGFSQGASMAARAAVRATSRADGLVIMGGDIPPDLRDDPSTVFPPTLIGVGDRDTWYGGARANADIEFLKSRGVAHEVVHFAGGHEFTDEFRQTAGRWIISHASGMDGGRIHRPPQHR